MNTSLGYRLLVGSGPLILLLRIVLLPVYLLYIVVTAGRNALYDAGLLQSESVAVPVISVGNVTVGGTGKTPLVIALAERALAAGRKVAIVTRGYGAPAGEHADEVALIARRVPGAMLVVSPDKRVGAQQAVEQGAEVVLLDDGLQHRRLHRDLDIAVVDARAPFGNGFQLPLGPLREQAAAVARADVVVLTHHDLMQPDQLIDVHNQVRAFRRDLPIVHARHTPVGVRSVASSDVVPAETLAGKELFLFCGIASPEGFRQTVASLGAIVTGVHAFGDHHAFSADDVALVRSLARTAQLVCTEKDAVKLQSIPGCDDVLCLVIDLEIEDGLPALPGIDTTPARA